MTLYQDQIVNDLSALVNNLETVHTEDTKLLITSERKVSGGKLFNESCSSRKVG